MTVQESIVESKMRLIELAEYLQNVSEEYKIHSVSRHNFYNIKRLTKNTDPKI